MDNADLQKLVEIAKMYHIQNMNQEQIAKVFGISRSAVSMCLTEAKNNGIIQVHINDMSVNNEELGREMEECFGLRKCIVVPSGARNTDVLLRIVISQAVRFAAEELFVSHSSVGIAWGTTCSEFMRSFPEDTNLCDISVVPLVGASPLLTQEYQLNESILMFAEKMRGVPLFIYSPGLVETLEDKRRILESNFMQPLLDRWGNMDYAMLGIGRRRENGELRLFYQDVEKSGRGNRQPKRSTQTMLDEICSFSDMAVGDICARQFDIYGRFADNDHNNKLIGVNGEQLGKIKHVLAVAVGSDKVFAIIGALRTKTIHYFVTDENTAKWVLEIMKSGKLPS